jgi:hypothetical protein
VNFVDALVELMFGETGQIRAYQGPRMLVFVVASTLMAFIVILVDRVIYSMRGTSVFKLTACRGRAKRAGS